MKEMIALEILRYIRNNDYIMDLLDKTDMDEAISELEALQSRRCDGCKYFNSSINRGLCFRLDIAVSKTFYCQGYEAKDTQC